MKHIYTFLFMILMLIGVQEINAQKDNIPLEPKLEQQSERLLIKIGMISKTKPAKLKFGDFATIDPKGASVRETDRTELDFSFIVVNQKRDSAFVEGVKNSSKAGHIAEKDMSVYITTSIDQDDLWVLLMTKTPGTSEFSLKNIYLTNGDDEITFNQVIGEQKGNYPETAPKGIEAFIDGNPIGAMQYYSGGSFSYKKYIWISNQFDAQMQLVVAAVFSSMMEIADYFEDDTITD